jgi:type III secretory pathway component EscS
MTLIYVVTALLVGAVAGLKVLAPRTKTKLDDDVVEFLVKYQVPIEDFLALLAKK